MGTPELRPATVADAPEISRIWREGWRDGHLGHTPVALVEARTDASFDHRAMDRIPHTTVAVIDEAVAGFIVIDDDEAEQVYVDRARRGTGLAAVLLAEAERQIAAAGHPRAWLAVAAGNERARSFYERSGWADAGAFDYQAEGPDGPIAVPCHRYERRFD